MASRNKQTQIHPHPKLQGGVAIGGVAVEAEFVHCYKYSVVDLQIIMYIRRHVTLVYPIYPSLFAFQSEHNLEASCPLTLLVWARTRVRKSRYWGETLQVPHPLLWRNETSLLVQWRTMCSPLHCKLLFVYIMCCRRTGQCFSLLRTRKSDVILT